MNQHLHYLPSVLVDKTLHCGKCDETFTPDWLAKRPPVTPFMLNNGLWAMPVSCNTKCPSCNHEVTIDVPKGSFGADYYVFADEAYRDFGDKYLVNYSFVGIQKKNYVELQSLVSSWKREVTKLNGGGQIDIAHWTELWSTSSRKKMSGASKLNKKDVIQLFNNLASRIAKNSNIRLYSSSVVIIKDKNNFKKQLKQMKEFVTFSLFSITLQELTQSGYAPKYLFEDDGKMGWLFDMFERIRLTLMFPFICNGKPIPTPEKLKKSNSENFLAGIEIADALCFGSARSLHNKYNNQDYELDMTKFGDVAFIKFDEKGDVYLERKVGYP